MRKKSAFEFLCFVFDTRAAMSAISTAGPPAYRRDFKDAAPDRCRVLGPQAHGNRCLAVGALTIALMDAQGSTKKNTRLNNYINYIE